MRRGRSPGFARAVAVGQHVFLRPPTRRDCREFVELRRTNRAFLKRWEPASIDGSDSFGDAAFTRLLRSARDPRCRRLLVCLVDTGTIVGQISLSAITGEPFGSCYLGYWIGANSARRGYMTEAVRLALRYAFRDLALHRVEANIVPENAASRALARRCGLRREGYSPRLLRIAGRWRDHERWALTVEDWRRSRSQSARRRGVEIR
jgi:ribosomal-protein-alanine N-acetyltransferase